MFHFGLNEGKWTFLKNVIDFSTNLFSFRILQHNKIKTITKKAFEGLEELDHL